MAKLPLPAALFFPFLQRSIGTHPRADICAKNHGEFSAAAQGTARLFEQFHVVNDGPTREFVTVPPDGDAAPALPTLITPPTPWNGLAPMDCDLTTMVSEGRAIDFGMPVHGGYFSDVATLGTPPAATHTHTCGSDLVIERKQPIPSIEMKPPTLYRSSIRCLCVASLFSFIQLASAAEVTAISADPGPTPGDLFQGAVVDEAPSTPARSGFDLRDAFGGEFSTLEPGRLVLDDYLGSAVQKIYFHTATPVTLTNYKLYLGDDSAGRGATHVEFALTDASFTSNTVISTVDLASPYPSNVGENNLRHIVVSDAFAPVVGQYFVLSLTPANPNTGVRVIEFDGNPPVPGALPTSVVAWGQGANGALGNGSSASEVSPALVSMAGALMGKTMAAVAGGYGHSLALDTDGQVYAWGNNESGQLGDGSTTPRLTPVAVDPTGALAGKTVTRIAACDGASFAVTSDGALITWGRQYPGSFTSSTTKQLSPVLVAGSLASKTVTDVACGIYHVLALTSDGEIHAWGINHVGQLGSGTSTGRDLPARMVTTGTTLSGKTVTAVSIIGGSSFALTSDGKVFAWGLNDAGQLGTGSTANRSLPAQVTGPLSSKTIKQIASGSGRHQLALADDGSLYAWGDNASGQLGNGGTTDSSTPVAVSMSGALGGVTVANVYAGADYSLVRSSEGQLFAWGADSDGQVGDGGSAEPHQIEPVAVDRTTSLSGQVVVAAGAGGSHALAITSGTAVPEITVRAPDNADVVNGGTVDLGNQAVGPPAAPSTFTIRNAGAAPLTITGVTLIGGDADHFGLNASGAIGSIAPGSSRTFSISFTPTALGIRGTVVSIASDDSDENPLDFTITANGATDFTPPRLDVLETWIEKNGTAKAFKLLLDAHDNVGIDKIQVRSKINSTAPLPDSTAWTDWVWQRDEPVHIRAVCKSIVIELRAIDAAGNASPIQRRIFKTPFPLSTAPNLTPKFVADSVFTGSSMNCRGLFAADFDGDGRDDILQIDRTTGLVKVRRQQTSGSFVSNGFNVAPNTVSDSAIGDFDHDTRPDIALVISNALVVYHNDGPDTNGTLQFSVMNVTGLATTGISSVVGVAAGDVTGEGMDDLIITGTGDDGMMGMVAKIANIIHNDQFQLGASNNAIAYPTSSAGPVRIGDVTGDGWNDVVTIDKANGQVLLFTNKRNGSFGGAGDGDAAARPQATLTGVTQGGLAAQALAVGDVTGNGRADVVVTLHGFAGRDQLFLQLLDSRGAAPLHPNDLISVGEGDPAASPTPFLSDVILQDLNGDRFPEAIVTNPFEAGTPRGGVRALRFSCRLDNTNTLTSLVTTTFAYPTGAPNPHRLAAGRFASDRPDVLLASGGSEPLQWVFSTFTQLSKAYDLSTGAETDSDARGRLDVNGRYVYEAYVGGLITYSISYVNNSATAITGGVVECLLPASLSIESGDAGYAVVPAGKSRSIRWTENIPAGSSGAKRFSVRVLSGSANTTIAPRASLKRGTAVLVTKAMPKVVLEEPLDLRLTVLTDSDSSGQCARAGDVITYRMRVKNRGTGPVSGFNLGLSIPANTSLLGGTSPPTPVLTGKFPNYKGVTWTDLSLIPDTEVTFDLRVQVSHNVETGTIIKNNTTTVTRSDGQKIVAPAASTTIESPLEITLVANKNIVRPGETIRYTFTVHNSLGTPVTNAKVVNRLPTGVSLLSAAANDGRDSPTGAGNFIYSAGTWTAAQLSPTTLPAFDRSTRILTWELGTVPAGAQRNIEFLVIVGSDIPTFANISGVSTTLEVQNKSYNFVAMTPSGKRIFAGAPVGPKAAAAANAGSPDLLSTALSTRRSLLSDPPLDSPQLSLFKTALGDGKTYEFGSETFTTVIYDTITRTGGHCDYVLTYENRATGVARNVMVRDTIPPGMTFVGHIARNATKVTNLIGYRFYDAAGKEMQVIGAEGFTDTNGTEGNGFYDAGEAYTDANRNGKYDGVTAALVRSIGFPAGDVGLMEKGSFIYRARTTSKPGSVISSAAGGISGVKNGLDYTYKDGYHLTADNLHFPVNGSPKAVHVLVTGPVSLDFQNAIVKSRSEMVGTEITQIAIPFTIEASPLLTLSGGEFTVPIPKGYLVTDAMVQDRTTPTPQTRPGTIVRNSAGVSTMTFPIDNWNRGAALFRVQLDPATKSVLKGSSGQIKDQLTITPTLSSGYLKSGKTVSVGPLSRPLGTLQVRDTVTAQASSMAMRGSAARAAAAPSQLSDAKIFVGRCAPVSVKRGDTFSYTIFVGNLTDLDLSFGTIVMSIPAGCDFVSASPYKYNALGVSSDVGGTFEVTPVPTAGKVTWKIGSFLPREGGAVTLTVKVRENFSGSRIDDNSCVFDVVNASGKTPGPLGVVVRAGNETAQASEILLSAASGLGMDSTSAVNDALAQNVTLRDGSCFITTGGADLLQLTNGVIVIPLGDGRVLTAGPPDMILASGIRLVKDDAMMRVAVGPGDSSGVQLTKLPTLPLGLIQPTNTLLANLHLAATSLVTARAANLVAAGGGNMVAAGAGNLAGNGGTSLNGPNGAKLVGNDGATLTPFAPLVAAGGGNLIGDGGSTMVAAGGLNLVAAGGGNLVAAGGGNLVGNDGGSLVAAGAGNLIGQDGGSLVAAGGLNLVAAGAGNILPTK